MLLNNENEHLPSAPEVLPELINIASLFRKQATQSPNATAVICDGLSYTYAQLNTLSDNIAYSISQEKIDTDFIAISSARTIETIAGLLGIMKAGKAYVVIDKTYPEDRLAQIIENATLRHIICDRLEADIFLSLGLTPIAIVPSPGSLAPVHQDLACVLYTSGSTGRPKGVCLKHTGLYNLVRAHAANSSPGIKNTLQFCHLSFDVSFQEIFTPLLSGNCAIIVPDSIRIDAYQLLDFIIDQHIHQVFLPYVTLQYLAEAAIAGNKYPTRLLEVNTGGESLKITPQIRQFFAAIPSAVLINSYGPSETSICVTEYRLSGSTEEWPALPPIGKPLAGTAVYLLNENLKEVAVGEMGEICIAGTGLASGYLKQPELTREKFIDWNPTGETKPIKLYRTGDYGILMADGNITFHGRKDDQVKIRGNRIELSEIELLLNDLPYVRQATVTAREDIPGQKLLVAYLEAKNGKQHTIAELREAVNKKLPEYMMPASFVWMKDLPKTTSGKINKKLLPPPVLQRPELSVLYKEPRGKTEELLAQAWKDLLQLDKVGTLDNFFELGGNSLLAQKMVALLKNDHHITLPVTKLYQFPSIQKLSAYLENGTQKKDRQQKQNNVNEEQDIAIIGMAGRFPGADSIASFWENIKAGKETISFFTKEELGGFVSEDKSNLPNYIAARGIIDKADEFDPSFFGLSPKLAELMDPQQRIFLEIAWEALEQSGYAKSTDAVIGVFAGCGPNTYYSNNVLSHPELIENMGNTQVVTVNDKDYVSTRVAYALDLKGPAVTVQSACSTSLLAVATAVESIRKGQCDMALAGGAAIQSPQKTGHLYEEGAIYSKDGHTRPFDSSSTGTVFSDGAGIVLLKRKSQAIKDGDTIYAVIKGIGISNDGGGKGSFSAPSAEGQAASINMAIGDAGINPSTISYIEAHGTGTPLGDPIEIEGLRYAFGETTKKQFCAIGSVKSNIGHLTIAAGVAGLIKTSLSLHHKELPASINFKNPNSNIDFENSPFYVQDKHTKWTTDLVRRAGVSSFGFGGTNVHVVLEEASPAATVAAPNTSRPTQLLTWSSRSEESANAYSQKLLEYISNTPAINLADIAYTLNSHRSTFAYRNYIVVSSATDAVQQLQSQNRKARKLQNGNDKVIFMFPGQGAQYINMGKDLYETEIVFREALDTCFNILQRATNEDFKTILYPNIKTEAAEAKLTNTRYSQPALFSISYALAKQWMSWGVQPAGFIGHSIGEIVAAHLAGVFTLEEALMLIATRGRLMSELPAGAMLSVRTSYENLKKILPEGLAIAAANSPTLNVVAGTFDEINAFSATLESQNIPSRVLHTSHAFHSQMMDPVVGPFEQVVKKINLLAPKLPIMSTVTGQWLKDEEATNPAYWANHLRATVRFSDAASRLIEDGYQLFLESGAGNVTSTLLRQQPTAGSGQAIASLERSSDNNKSEQATLLDALGNLWAAGAFINWQQFYSQENRKQVHTLPTYAFNRKRYWVEPSNAYRIAKPDQTNIPQEPISQSLPTIMRKDQINKKVREIFEEASGIEMQKVPDDISFLELGFDSLLLTQIAAGLKKDFGLPITFRQLSEQYSSITLLAGYLDQQLPAEQFSSNHPPAIPVVNGTVPTSTTRPVSGAGDVLGLINQQIQLLSQQVALLQGNNKMPVPPADPVPPVLSPASLATSSDQLTPEEIAELKKPFGASARIERKASVLTPRQEGYLNQLIEQYNKKTAGSKSYTQTHRSYMADPRVVTGFKPHTKELVYSIVVNKSKGSRLWDIDGNEYIDTLNGFGSNMLGHQPDFIVDVLKQQLDAGIEVGPQHSLSGDVCKLFCEITGHERAALCNTGSEAVLGAMRVARTATNKSIIVAFSGSYHGITDEVLVRGTKKLKTYPAASGIMIESVQNMLILDYGKPESLAIIQQRKDEIAAVLVEPVQSRRPDFLPVEFLKELRTLTTAADIALIFDEVITGFRMHLRGMQGILDIQPDIAAYGKVVGGGISIGVIAGNQKYMDAFDGGYWQYGDDSMPEAGVTYFAGTFVRHPLALAAAKASLEYFKEQGNSLAENLTTVTRNFVSALNAISKKYQSPISVVSYGSLWRIKFETDIPYTELLFVLMRKKGIHILDGFPCYLTTAYSQEDIQQLLQAFEESIVELIEADFMPGVLKSDARTEQGKLESDAPPVPGAKLGRDTGGNPAWFIADPQRPGKFLQLK